MDIKDCLEQGFLKKIEIDEQLIEKEINESKYDLDKAEKALDEEDFKWSIVKSYYSMFHTARALLFKLGYSEKRHFAISVVLEHLNKNGMLESKYVNDFSAAISSREDADYHYTYSKEIASHNLSIAKEFFDRIKKLLKEALNSMKTVMCAGTFDTIHPGHLYYLSEAKKYGNKLIVIVARDETSEKFKGKKPMHNEKERLEQVKTLEIVDEAVLGKHGNIFNIIEDIKPDVICLGYDQKVQKQELEEELKKRNIKADVVRIGSYMPSLYKSSKLRK